MENENLNEIDNLNNLDNNQIEALYSDIIEGPEILLSNKCYCADPPKCYRYNCLY